MLALTVLSGWGNLLCTNFLGRIVSDSFVFFPVFFSHYWELADGLWWGRGAHGDVDAI
ncbi:hypothetical protein FC50_GL000871 [Lacticaseibacillus pantheris DSM 15945 = JCM 12539 = NBRC 106106]|uniref:Uncharacterized protein n=1 Tax=Lacticaseibacillus pantheris DSM 15945 = JCM 12539 = NBRC 106106 TaxID=1423783 RepID=A0A0R1TYQ2_9LACO|nr:hypothetical protein FC50_GL000871 [Lacticaseibacillus pantheris DSM 15945 = JCM 12539 = NBRC 106106]